MIDRFIYKAIEDGIAEINANPNHLDDIFRQFELSAGELAAVKTYFAREGVRVIHNYPRAEVKPPIYSIVLESEGELSQRGHFLADDLPDVNDVPDLAGVDLKGAIYEARYAIHVVTEMPDVTRYYYEILRSILIERGPYFDAQGVFAIHFSGQDMALDPRFSPENYFVRKLHFEAQYVFRRLDRDPAGKFSSIRGLFVDGGAAPGNTGDVLTNIEAYVLGED